MEELDLFECTFSESEVKRFLGALKFLYRISSTLLLEAFPEKLVLRSINQNQSAYTRVEFGRDFFESYFTRETNHPSIQCGVLLKSCLAAFRTAHAVQSVSLAIDSSVSVLRFQLSCAQGVNKTYAISCMQDVEILSADFEVVDMPCQLLVDSRAFQGLLSSFHPSTSEIVMVATPGGRQGRMGQPRLQLQSYTEGLSAGAVKKAEMQTEITVPDDDTIRKFVLNTSDAIDVTFALKELKAALSYSEGLQMYCALFLEGPGLPLVAKPFSESIPASVFYAELILSTLEFSVLNHGTNSTAPAADDTSENERELPHHSMQQVGRDSFTFSHQKEQMSGSEVRLPGRGHLPDARARPISGTQDYGSQPSGELQRSMDARSREPNQMQDGDGCVEHNQEWNFNEGGGEHDDGEDDEYVGGTPERAIGDATQPFNSFRD